MIELQTIIGAISALAAGGGFGWFLRSNRRKASAEADSAEESAKAQIESRYETMLKFLQSQLLGAGEENAKKTEIIRGLHEDVLKLTRRVYETEMKYVSSRCDIKECQHRRPPLPWNEMGSNK